jgi:hypothetical protein
LPLRAVRVLMLRVWVETMWFRRFWDVRREYASHLALQNANEDRLRRFNGYPPSPKRRTTWSLVRELLQDVGVKSTDST